MTDHDIVEAMLRYGGGFIKTLAELWFRADLENRARIKAAFPEYWQTYAAMATVSCVDVEKDPRG